MIRMRCAASPKTAGSKRSAGTLAAAQDLGDVCEMSTVYDELDETVIGFIRRQKLFFVATAPLSAEGSVNVSPKGYDSLAIIDSKAIGYWGLGGSGIETHAH